MVSKASGKTLTINGNVWTSKRIKTIYGPARTNNKSISSINLIDVNQYDAWIFAYNNLWVLVTSISTFVVLLCLHAKLIISINWINLESQFQYSFSHNTFFLLAKKIAYALCKRERCCQPKCIAQIIRSSYSRQKNIFCWQRQWQCKST